MEGKWLLLRQCCNYYVRRKESPKPKGQATHSFSRGAFKPPQHHSLFFCVEWVSGGRQANVFLMRAPFFILHGLHLLSRPLIFRGKNLIAPPTNTRICLLPGISFVLLYIFMLCGGKYICSERASARALFPLTNEPIKGTRRARSICNFIPHTRRTMNQTTWVRREGKNGFEYILRREKVIRNLIAQRCCDWRKIDPSLSAGHNLVLDWFFSRPKTWYASLNICLLS